MKNNSSPNNTNRPVLYMPTFFNNGLINKKEIAMSDEQARAVKKAQHEQLVRVGIHFSQSVMYPRDLKNHMDILEQKFHSIVQSYMIDEKSVHVIVLMIDQLLYAPMKDIIRTQYANVVSFKENDKGQNQFFATFVERNIKKNITEDHIVFLDPHKNQIAQYESLSMQVMTNETLQN